MLVLVIKFIIVHHISTLHMIYCLKGIDKKYMQMNCLLMQHCGSESSEFRCLMQVGPICMSHSFMHIILAQNRVCLHVVSESGNIM